MPTHIPVKFIVLGLTETEISTPDRAVIWRQATQRLFFFFFIPFFSHFVNRRGLCGVKLSVRTWVLMALLMCWVEYFSSSPGTGAGVCVCGIHKSLWLPTGIIMKTKHTGHCWFSTTPLNFSVFFYLFISYCHLLIGFKRLIIKDMTFVRC